MWKPSLLAVLLWTGIASAQTGFFIRSDCSTISAPVDGGTLCLQSTTTGGRTIGHVYTRISSAWTDITGNGVILGSVAADQVAVGSAANTVAGSNNFKWTSS